MKSLLIAGLVVLTSACALDATSGSSGEDVSNTTYVDILDFSGVDQGAFYDVRSKLDSEFAANAGYPSITSLGLACSVSSKVGNVHDCVWTFAAATSVVNPNTSTITSDVPSFQCHTHPKTTGPKLVALLGASADALHEPLPGVNASFADGLADCFQHPIGGTPLLITTVISPTYVEASDYYTSASNKAQWAKATTALHTAFDYVCGDTFCDGDYPNIQSLQFVCSVTKSTGNVKACSWIFEGSYASPSKSGNEVVSPKAWRCDVPVKGTISQLMGVLNAPANLPEDVIHRPLPGGTASAYDAIANCL